MEKDRYDPAEPDWHREFRRRSVREGMRRKAEEGGTPGCAPVGYRNRRDEDGNAYVEIDPVQGPLVREAFELAATGKYSLRELLAVMTENGLRSRRGRLLQATGLWRILTNPYYYGFLTSDGSFRKGKHEPLVSPAQFELVRHSLDRRRRR